MRLSFGKGFRNELEGGKMRLDWCVPLIKRLLSIILAGLLGTVCYLVKSIFLNLHALSTYWEDVSSTLCCLCSQVTAAASGVVLGYDPRGVAQSLSNNLCVNTVVQYKFKSNQLATRLLPRCVVVVHLNSHWSGGQFIKTDLFLLMSLSMLRHLIITISLPMTFLSYEPTNTL